MKQVLIGLGLLCTSLFAAGCASNEPPPQPATIPQIDRAITETVKVRIKGDGELAGELINVNAKGDTVVLEGSVQTNDEKERAEKLARSVKGVNKVENKLEVKPNAGNNP